MRRTDSAGGSVLSRLQRRCSDALTQAFRRGKRAGTVGGKRPGGLRGMAGIRVAGTAG
jgi:hypothetical protein